MNEKWIKRMDWLEPAGPDCIVRISGHNTSYDTKRGKVSEFSWSPDSDGEGNIHQYQIIDNRFKINDYLYIDLPNNHFMAKQWHGLVKGLHEDGPKGDLYNNEPSLYMLDLHEYQHNQRYFPNHHIAEDYLYLGNFQDQSWTYDLYYQNDFRDTCVSTGYIYVNGEEDHEYGSSSTNWIDITPVTKECLMRVFQCGLLSDREFIRFYANDLEKKLSQHLKNRFDEINL